MSTGTGTAAAMGPEATGVPPGSGVPPSLRRWFVVHFWADIVFAVPLFVAPAPVLRTLGWNAVDPVSARLVAAALFGIGIASLLGRGEGLDAFRALLRLKCIWSAAAIAGLLLSLAQGAPLLVWGFVAIFAAFAAVWNTYRIRLRP
jgi:hypothetical protein